VINSSRQKTSLEVARILKAAERSQDACFFYLDQETVRENFFGAPQTLFVAP
jgi:hypothetical protein